MNTPDTPALRTFLQAINTKLDVPEPAHPGDHDLELYALRAATHDVQIVVRALLDGVLDWTAIQAYGCILTGHPVTPSYETTERAA